MSWILFLIITVSIIGIITIFNFIPPYSEINEINIIAVFFLSFFFGNLIASIFYILYSVLTKKNKSKKIILNNQLIYLSFFVGLISAVALLIKILYF